MEIGERIEVSAYKADGTTAPPSPHATDFAEIKGQGHVKQALELAKTPTVLEA